MPPERLKKGLALGWSLATARARHAWAAAETANGAAGSAVAGIDVRALVSNDRAIHSYEVPQHVGDTAPSGRHSRSSAVSAVEWQLD